MALRLPIPTRSVREPSRTRHWVAVAFASIVFITLPMRLFLAALEIADWTTAWRTIELITLPFVLPVDLILPFDSILVGNARLIELIATILFAAIAAYWLALLTVRRRR